MAISSSLRESDEWLYRRFLAGGSERCFSELVRRHQHFAFRVAFARCGMAQLAEEAVQEAFLRLACPASRFSANALGGCPNFRSLLYGVVWQVATNICRSERRTRLRAQASLPMRRAGSGRQPERREALDAATARVLRKEVAKLSEAQRVAIVLHYQEGLTQRQIAVLTRVSQPEVGRRISQGLALLRARLAAGGVSLAALALPQALASESLCQASQALETTLTSPGFLRAAARASSNPLPVSALPRIPALPCWLLSAGCLLAAATGLWCQAKDAAQSGPREQPAVLSRAARSAPAGAPGDPAPAVRPATRRWTFERGFPTEFHPLSGEWLWRPAQADLPARIRGGWNNGGAALMLPTLHLHGLLQVKIDAAHLFPSGNFRFGWTDGRRTAPSKMWQLKERIGLKRPYRTETNCYFLDRYLAVCFRDSVFFIEDFGVSHPAPHLFLACPGRDVISIEVREIEAGAVPPLLRDIPKLLNGRTVQMEFEALEFRNPIAPFGPGR